MARSFIRYRAILLGTTFAAGAQTLAARRAIAHSDHYETEQPEQTNSSTNDQQPELSSEPAATLETAEPEKVPVNKVDSEVNAAPAAKNPKDKRPLRRFR